MEAKKSLVQAAPKKKKKATLLIRTILAVGFSSFTAKLTALRW